MISPWAKFDYVDHSRTDQSSIIRFVEDNWHMSRIPGSFDNVAGPLDNMFDFRGFFGNPLNLLPMPLNPDTGQPLFR
jgi:phospholipase C